MPTDPFVAPTARRGAAPGAEPRAGRPHAAGAARGGPTGPATWSAASPQGALLGSPGPNIGYALTLADRMRDRFVIAPHEHVDDVIAVVGELAMKRAASFGRAPVIPDVECAAICSATSAGAARAGRVADASTSSGAAPRVRAAPRDLRRRRLDVLRLAPQALPGRVVEVDEADWQVDPRRGIDAPHQADLTMVSGSMRWILALHRARGAPQGAPPLRRRRDRAQRRRGRRSGRVPLGVLRGLPRLGLRPAARTPRSTAATAATCSPTRSSSRRSPASARRRRCSC